MGMKNLVRLALAAVVAIAGGIAGAGEGRLEINQACAVNTGCFPGDTPGFPVTIPGSGSYVVTGNLDAPDGQTGIMIGGLGGDITLVSLDLNGFEIAGGPGAGRGILANSAITPVIVRNGSVRGFGGSGVLLVQGSVEHVTAVDNGGTGIEVLNAGAVSNCDARRNGGDGIKVARGGIVVNSLSSSNVRGFVSSGQSILRSSVATGNSGSGAVNFDTVDTNLFEQNGDFTLPMILAGNNAVITNNQIRAHQNQAAISCSNVCTVRGNTVTSLNLFGIGIQVSSGSRVESNGVSGFQTGVSGPSDYGYANNTMAGNTTNVVSGVNAGGNVCDSALCP